jgi:hypothetical protein
MARLKLSRILDKLLACIERRPVTLKLSIIPSMKDLPQIDPKCLYVVGHRRQYKWAILACPCGCGERVDICLMPSARPRWEIAVIRGKATLYPSIWIPSDRCGSHFWIRENRIIWCSTQPLSFSVSCQLTGDTHEGADRARDTRAVIEGHNPCIRKRLLMEG